MALIVCPKCGKELNDYEINKLWCTNCNLKFKSIEDLYENNPELENENKTTKKILNNFLISTGYKLKDIKLLNISVW